MAGTLLVGPPGASWRGLVREGLGKQDLIVLDPLNAEHGFPARVILVQEGRVPHWRFVGSLDPLRNPMAILSGLSILLSHAGPNPWVQLFSVRSTPVIRQLALACSQVMQPDRILMPEGSEFFDWGWPVGPEDVAPEAPLPQVVYEAQRKARWIDLWDSGEDHEVDWAKVHIEGMRLGTGVHVPQASKGVWAELTQGTLLVVSEKDLADGELKSLMEHSGSARSVCVSPESYLGLVCSFAEQDGADFAMGCIQGVDLARRKFMIRSKAVLESPIRILKVGSLKIDRSGAELEEVKAWSV